MEYVSGKLVRSEQRFGLLRKLLLHMLSAFCYVCLSAHVQLIVTTVSVSPAFVSGGKPPTHRKEQSGTKSSFIIDSD